MVSEHMGEGIGCEDTLTGLYTSITIVIRDRIVYDLEGLHLYCLML